MECIKNIDSIDVFSDFENRPGSIELDRQGHSQFYASASLCAVILYKCMIRKMGGKKEEKIGKNNFLFYVMYYEHRFLKDVFFLGNKPVPFGISYKKKKIVGTQF